MRDLSRYARTDQGGQAYEILAWVYDDPPGRAATGLARLNILARGVTDVAAQHEIADVGTMLSRLNTAPPATISGQLP